MAIDIERRGNPWRIAIWGTAALLLLLPLIAMQFTDEVDWTAFDFILIGAMLIAACGAYEIATRLSGSSSYRAAVGIAIVTGFLLVWINLAVGIIGDERNPANLMFVGVLVIGMIGAAIAFFEPRGMANALVVMAIAQALVGAVVLVRGLGYEAALLSGCFVAAWLVSAGLFRKAAMEAGPVRTSL